MPTKTTSKRKSALKKQRKPALSILHARLFSKIPWLVHGFSTRIGGFSHVYGGNALNLGFTKEDSHDLVEQNQIAFIRAIGATTRNQPWPLITARQIHSDLVHCINEVPAEPPAGDGLITALPNIVLGIRTADCLPIILVDTKKQAVGVFHAGWRGTARRSVEKGVGEMHRCFGSAPHDLKAAIGPGIRSCCYEVGEEVRHTFESQFAYAATLFREAKESDQIRERYPLLFLTARAPGHSDLPKKVFLDLAEANRRQLLDAGVPARNIETSELCTVCRNDLLFSHRAEKGVTGRLMAVAGIRTS